MLKASLLLLSFNQLGFIDQALDSAFLQDYDHLEIIIADDGSTDGTFERIQERVAGYSGPHSAIVLPKRPNLGLIGNLNRGLEVASGELVIVAAGDDVSHTNRVSRLVNVYLTSNRPLLIHSKARVINRGGDVQTFEEPPEKRRCVFRIPDAGTELSLYLGATGAWSRELLEAFPPISELGAFEDLVMGFRAALHDGVCYVDECLVDYRVGDGLSQRHPRNFDEYRQRRKRILKVNIAVFRQRLRDLGHVAPLHSGLRPVLEARIRNESGRLRFYGDSDTLNMAHFLSDWVVISGWIDECRKWVKNAILFSVRAG